MTDLATRAMDAHGGLERWRRLKTVSARLRAGWSPVATEGPGRRA